MIRCAYCDDLAVRQAAAVTSASGPSWLVLSWGPLVCVAHAARGLELVALEGKPVRLLPLVE